MDYAEWALGQVRMLQPDMTERTWPSIRELVNALAALRRPTSERQLFGLSASNVPAAAYPAIDTAILDALLAWRARFEAADDVASLLDIDAFGRRLDAAELRLAKRFPLRSDPLGARDGLATPWRHRLDKLDEAVAGRRTLDAVAVRIVGADDRKPNVTFGEPDETALYEFALRHETRSRATFPREIAALWTTANGVFFDDIPFLSRIDAWRDEDRGLCIGSGGYEQGSLTLTVTKKSGLLGAKVTDRDDDGVVRARYADLGALFDALLGP